MKPKNLLLPLSFLTLSHCAPNGTGHSPMRPRTEQAPPDFCPAVDPVYNLDSLPVGPTERLEVEVDSYRVWPLAKPPALLAVYTNQGNFLTKTGKDALHLDDLWADKEHNYLKKKMSVDVDSVGKAEGFRGRIVNILNHEASPESASEKSR